MRLSDVLKLPKQPHSLSIIKDFLEKPLSHLDYQAAFSYYFETRAKTLVGEPEPPTIFSGAAITIAPVVGNLSRLRS
mgnify:CR=1 FL=1